jgi:hypothetical protein
MPAPCWSGTQESRAAGESFSPVCLRDQCSGKDRKVGLSWLGKTETFQNVYFQLKFELRKHWGFFPVRDVESLHEEQRLQIPLHKASPLCLHLPVPETDP